MGLREWWDRISGNTNKPAETGLSDEPEEAYDEYEADKANRAADQRDPGVMGMGQSDFKP